MLGGDGFIVHLEGQQSIAVSTDGFLDWNRRLHTVIANKVYMSVHDGSGGCGDGGNSMYIYVNVCVYV